MTTFKCASGSSFIRSSLLVLLVLGTAARKSRSLSFSRCTPGFLMLAPCHGRRDIHATKTATALASATPPNPSDDQDDKQGTLPAKFNPFSYQKTSGSINMNSPSSSSSSYSTSFYSTSISLRKTQMQELNQQFLSTTTESQLQELLESNKEFLLEPLEENDSLLEEDSIYSPTMTRAERYQAYRRAMEKRLASSRNAQVKRVLAALKDFVLSHE